MTHHRPPATVPEPGPLFIASGGSGSSGELLVHTALAQFVGPRVPVRLVPHVRRAADVAAVVHRTAAEKGVLVHTFVNPRLRAALIRRCRQAGVAELDLMGPLLALLEQRLRTRPVGRPGLYRQLNQAYFRRVDAIDFTMRHDDGLCPEDLPLADIVLLGVSRTGKTPLSMYLAVLGWRVANVPLSSNQEPPAELRRVPRHRLFGLNIHPAQLGLHRQSRQQQMRGTLPAAYTAPVALRAELETAERFFRRLGCAVIDVSGKPLETTADEILSLRGAGTRTA